MTLVARLVTVRVRTLTHAAPLPWSSVSSAYVLVVVGPRMVVRRPLASNVTSPVSLHSAASPVEVTLSQATAGPIPISVLVWNDPGDAVPTQLVRVDGVISATALTGPLTLRTSNPAVQLDCDVTVQEVANAVLPVPVARGPQAGTQASTAVVMPIMGVSLTAIDGLYKPGASVPAGQHHTQRPAEPLAGYTSEDDKGRIYLERNLSRDWQRRTQVIVLHAQVHALVRHLPRGLRIRWSVVDPDNASDDVRMEVAVPGGLTPGPDAKNLHREWGRLFDPADYDAAGVFTGSGDGDNRGAPAVSPPFVQHGGFHTSSSVAGPPASIETDVLNGVSEVKLHCPTFAGDSFFVKAEVVGATTGFRTIEARTGLMTMWHLVRVQYLKMPNALALPVSDVPAHLVPAFVQMEITDPHTVPDLEFLGPGDPAFRVALNAYLDRHFTNRRTGGWFCLLSARGPYPPPALPSEGPPVSATAGSDPAPPTVAANGEGTSHDVITIAGDQSSAGSVKIDLTRADGTLSNLVFNVDSANFDSVTNTTRIVLMPHDIQGDFTATNGSLTHAMSHRQFHYFDGQLDNGVWQAGRGYGISGAVTVRIRALGHYPSATSPTVTDASGDDFFAGRTTVFTRQVGANVVTRDRWILTVVHELTHAFGTPHKCGWFNFMTPRPVSGTCCMNYGMHGVRAHGATQLDPLVPRGESAELCGVHIKTIRETILSRNTGLAWP